MADSLLARAVKRVGHEQLLSSLTPAQVERLPYEWEAWARPEQLPPEGDWLFWLLLAGRGFGKSRTGAEWSRMQAHEMPGSHGALVAPTAADARDVMVKTLLACSPQWEGCTYEPSKRRVTWANGTTATLYSAEEPDRLRGPQHGWGWCFIAGTLVRLADGDAPIESLRVGDYAMTRIGRRRIIAVAARSAVIGTVKFSNGVELTGTADHPVLTNNGWTRLAELSIGSSAMMAMSTPISVSREATIGTRGGLYSGIDGSGKELTDQFQMDTRFITSMRIQAITVSKTSNASVRLSIGGDTLGQVQCGGLYTRSRSSRVASAARTWSHPGVIPVSVNHVGTSEQMNEEPPSAHAGTAASCSSQSVDTIAVSVASTWEPIGTDTVYNITVEDAHEYFANGILVHNCDEVAAWPYAEEVLDMLLMTLRVGAQPQLVLSTTPRPVPVIRRIIKDPGTRISTGSTYDNAANLSPSFIESIKTRYDGTRLGQQEIYARVLDEIEGALWNHAMIDKVRRAMPPELRRVVVAVDPSGSAKRTADEAGIVVAGIGDCPCLGRVETHAFVLADITGRYSPRDMGTKAVDAYHKWRCDRLVAEDNFGGVMVHDLIQLIDPRVSYRAVHASRGKIIRAEPVAALYEQGKVHHVGMHGPLEDELCGYAPLISTESPGRLDALVWAITDLMLGESAASFGAIAWKPPARAF